MDFYIDIGNSRLKWGWCARSTNWQTNGSIYTPPLNHGFLDQIWGGQPKPKTVTVSNVAGTDARSAIDQWVKTTWEINAQFACYDEGIGNTMNGYEDKAQLGVDRWLALLAAREKYDGALCVIDCGTAITVDQLSAHDEHGGGIIIPGRALLARAAWHIPALLPKAEDTPVKDWPWETTMARDTTTALRNGINCAVISSLSHIISQTLDTYGPTLRFILTGGDVPPLTQLPTATINHEPDMVLRGLACYAQKKGLT